MSFLDRSFPGLSDHEVHQKRDELLGGMALGRLPEHGARLGIEGGVQGQGSMPIVFEAMPLRPTRRQGQHWIFAIQGLDGRLLIDAPPAACCGGVR
jgi:hypothetical protein